MCAWRQAPVKLTAASRRELPKDTLTMRAAGCMPAVCARIVQNVVNAIEKWVPFTPKFSQRRWLLGLRPRPPNSERDRLRRLPVLHAELKMVLTQFKIEFHSHSNAPNSIGGWGSAPDPPPPITRESTFGACQSDASS